MIRMNVIKMMLFGIMAVMSAQCSEDRTMPYHRNLIDIWSENESVLSPDSLSMDGIKRVDDEIRAYHVNRPVLECFTSVDSTNRDAIIVCPGGGFNFLAYDLEGSEIAEWLLEQGFDAYVLSYHVPQMVEKAVADMRKSIDVVKSKGYRSVGAIGFSAGGYLICRAIVDTARIDYSILIYPAFLNDNEGKLKKELSYPMQSPDFFIFGAQDDVLCGLSVPAIASGLDSMNINNETHYIPTGGHGYGMRHGAGKKWPLLLSKWLKMKR